MTDEWPNTCVICARRDRQTRLKFGHVCAACADRLAADLRAIPELAAMAAAALQPGQGSTGTTHAAYGSRPPINLDAVDAALCHVPGHDAPLLVILEEWERMVRQERDYVPYGPASAARNATVTTDHTQASLVGVCAFLAAQVDWVISEPTFPADDFADEVSQCVRAVRRWDVTAEDRGQVVPCPTVMEDGTDCGKRLGFRGMDEVVTCRRCGATRDVPQLLMAADADNALVDAEALAGQFGLAAATIRKWARQGKVERQGQRYRYGDVRAIVGGLRVG